MFKKVVYKILMIAISIIFVMQLFPVIQAEETKVVRVGWFYSDLFSEGTSNEEKKSGYCYDYLQKVSDYTNWEYEYVYGSWSELLEKLESGEIDILGGVSITDERLETMSFPSISMGTEQYFIYKKSNDESISSSNLSSFNGKTIALVKDNLMSSDTEKWIEENNLDVNIKYYDSINLAYYALVHNEVDLITRSQNGFVKLDDITAITKIGEADYYLAVNKNRTDLLDDLNKSLNTMLSIDSYILQELQSENFGLNNSDKIITKEEKDWLDTHDSITVGFLNDYLPYCNEDDEGNITGLLVDELNGIFDNLELENIPTITYVAYNNYSEIIEALKNNEIDIGFPVSDNNWRHEQEGINASTAVINDSGTLFYKKYNEKNDIVKLAVNKNNLLQIDYTKDLYPNGEIVEFDSATECLDAVLKDKVDGTIIDTMRIQFVTSNSKYTSLTYGQLSSSNGKCFGVKKGNSSLLLLLNRGIKLLGSSYGLDSSYKYLDSFFTYDITDFVKDNFGIVAAILSIFVITIIILLFIILERKEKQYKQEEKLKSEAEKANSSKTIFLFNMSHDIRTPMNAVLGFTNLMEKEINNPDKLKDYISKIRVSGEYLLNLINNVLEVARIDSGKEVVDENFTDILGEQYFIILENDIKKKNLHIEKEIDIQHRYIYADEQKIREVVMNLLSNAVKYTPDGGTIKLTLKETPSEIEGYTTYTTIVQDTGIGMTKEFQEHIFESFTREQNTTESKVMGTGLGMAIVKRLMDLMKGTITVESEPGKGSTFTATVSVKLVENPEKVLAEQKKIHTQKKIDFTNKRILLAEDNELNAEIAIALLEETGAIVEVAKDGIECVDKVRNHDSNYYDLILMDIQMPNLNGYEATKMIRKLSDSKKARLPIIAMTANAFEEDRMQAFKAGMNGHLTKPIDIHKLMDTVSMALNQRGNYD